MKDEIAEITDQVVCPEPGAFLVPNCRRQKRAEKKSHTTSKDRAFRRRVRRQSNVSRRNLAIG